MAVYAEIAEQPVVLSRAIEGARQDIAGAADLVRSRNPAFVLIAARGSSDNVARYAKYVLGIRNGLPVALAAPSLWSAYGARLRLDQGLVIGISQSGQSPDLVGVVEAAREQGCPSIAITNDPSSPLATAATRVIDVHAGEERAVAATKSYTAQLLAVAYLSEHLASDPSGELGQVAGLVSAALASEGMIEEIANDFAGLSRACVIGRGYHMATAFEWALKMEELAQMTVHPYSVADFLHGPIATVDREVPVLAVASEGPMWDQVEAVIRRASLDREAMTLMLSETASQAAAFNVSLPKTPEWLAPLVHVVGAQLFTYHLARAKGLDPDLPRELSKVTRTT